MCRPAHTPKRTVRGDPAVQHTRTPTTSLAAVVQRWPIVALIAVPLTFGAALFVSGQPNQYESSAVVSFAPRDGDSFPAICFLFSFRTTRRFSSPTRR